MERMVCSCNNLVMDKQLGDQLDTRAARPWRSICNVWKLSKEIEQVCKNGIRVVGAMLIWEDLWIGDMALRCKFPRLYSLSLQKHIKIKDYGLWDGLTWCWNLQWRRELFELEKELVVQLQTILNRT